MLRQRILHAGATLYEEQISMYHAKYLLQSSYCWSWNAHNHRYRDLWVQAIGINCLPVEPCLEDDEDCCVVCLDSLREVIFIPCGHMVGACPTHLALYSGHGGDFAFSILCPRAPCSAVRDLLFSVLYLSCWIGWMPKYLLALLS